MSKVSSLAIAALCIAIVWPLAGGEAALRSGFAALLPLALIWFPDEFGSYVGGGGLGRPGIDQESPAWAMAALGWLLLAACVGAALLLSVR